MRSFWSFLEPLKSSAKFLKIQSALPRSGSLLWLVSFFFAQDSRRSWGRNAWRTPKNVCVGGYSLSLLNKCACLHFFWRKILVQSKLKSSGVLLYDSLIFIFSHPGCATLLKSRIINREVVFLYIDDPNDRFLKPAVIRKRNVAMNIYERSQMAITWLSYVVILCKLYLHNILPSLLSDFLRVRVRVRVIVGLIFVNPTIVLTETIYCFCFFFPRYLKFGAHTSWYTS